MLRAISFPNTTPARSPVIASITAGRNMASSTPSSGNGPFPAVFSIASSDSNRCRMSGAIRRSKTATISFRIVPK